MIVIDAHLDLAWNAVQWNRDLRAPVYTIRTREARVAGRGRGQNTVALPQMLEGRIALCFGTLLARVTGNPVPHSDYHSVAQAYGAARGQLAYYQALAALGNIQLITDRILLERHIRRWQAWDANPDGDPPPVGCIISMESADAVMKPADLHDWYQQGVRIIGPAHYGTGRYAGGTSVEEGFSNAGFDLLDEMTRLGITLDLTHLSDRAFWQAVERFEGTLIASHNNCRALVPHQRQLDDRQIKALIEHDGVIGVAMDVWMLRPGWIKDHSSNDGITLDDLADHIDHVCQLAGNAHHVGIGSDLDGGFGREQSPTDLETIADVQRLAPILAARGYVSSDIDAIMHGNWLRLLRRALPERSAD